METSKEWAKYVFSQEEKRDLAASLADLTLEVESLEEQKKTTATQFKNQIDKITAELKGAAQGIRSGYEMRYVDCEVTNNFAEKRVDFFRVDTGELIRTRDMRPEELQGNLFEDN